MAEHRSVTRRKARRRNRSKKTSMYHPNRPRLVVYRSNKHFEVQIIDDFTSSTITSASSKDKDFKKSLEKAGTKTEISKLIGKKIAEKAKSNKIESVVLDRNGYPYHGRVKAFADSARKNGLNL